MVFLTIHDLSLVRPVGGIIRGLGVKEKHLTDVLKHLLMEGTLWILNEAVVCVSCLECLCSGKSQDCTLDNYDKTELGKSGKSL